MRFQRVAGKLQISEDTDPKRVQNRHFGAGKRQTAPWACAGAPDFPSASRPAHRTIRTSAVTLPHNRRAGCLVELRCEFWVLWRLLSDVNKWCLLAPPRRREEPTGRVSHVHTHPARDSRAPVARFRWHFSYLAHLDNETVNDTFSWFSPLLDAFGRGFLGRPRRDPHRGRIPHHGGAKKTFLVKIISKKMVRPRLDVHTKHAASRFENPRACRISHGNYTQTLDPRGR